MSDKEVELFEVTKSFGKIKAVKGISLQIKKGEFFFLVGPSGCGKTTTLRMLAGFDQPNAGSIKIRGQVVNHIPPEKRNTGMVFQNWALFPHKTVFENIAFGLKMRKVSNDVIKEKVGMALDLIHLPGFENRYPDQLSGGQKQRVALARALVIEPSVLLLDEPLSSLDAKIREQMRIEINSLLKRLNMTAIYVTHDQAEALAMADRIAVMDDGLIKQVGTPIEIYEGPTEEFVANFIGETNALKGRITEISNARAIFVSDQGIKMEISAKEGWQTGSVLKIFVRPERIVVYSDPPDGLNCQSGKIKHVTYMGSYIRYHVAVGNGFKLRVDEQNNENRPIYKIGDKVFFFMNQENCCIFKDFGKADGEGAV